MTDAVHPRANGGHAVRTAATRRRDARGKARGCQTGTDRFRSGRFRRLVATGDRVARFRIPPFLNGPCSNLGVGSATEGSRHASPRRVPHCSSVGKLVLTLAEASGNTGRTPTRSVS